MAALLWTLAPTVAVRVPTAAAVGATAKIARPYCNVDMNTGVIPPPSHGDRSELLQVHVLIRHGSRTKDAVEPVCWAGMDEVEYNCSAALLEGPSAPAVGTLTGGATLFQKSYTTGRNKLRGSCALGQLVSDGLAQQRANGRHLRRAYAQLLPATPIGHEEDFYLRSDDCPRTLASGQELFAAMYEDALANGTSFVVPWHTMDRGGDAETIEPSKVVCPALEAAALKAQLAFRESAHHERVSVPLARSVSLALNRTVGPGDLQGILDCLMSVQCPTVPSTGGEPPPSLTRELQDRVIDEVAYQLYSLCNDTQVARYGAGPLLGEILVRMEGAAAAAAHGQRAAPKFVLVSGHDTGPMAPVLGALRVGGAEFPRFGDLLSVEVHRVQQPMGWKAHGAGGVAVRLVHNGKVVTPLVPGCPAAAELCPFDAFHSHVSGLVPTAAQCGRSDSPSWWPQPMPWPMPHSSAR